MKNVIFETISQLEELTTKNPGKKITVVIRVDDVTKVTIVKKDNKIITTPVKKPGEENSNS
jgi:hypothetical protein